MDEKVSQQNNNPAMQVCSSCHTQVSTAAYFCHNCGKQLQQKLLSTSVARQLIIYLVSIFLPPFGLWPAIKYLQQKDQKAKAVGIAAIILTVISVVVTLYVYKLFMDQFYHSLNVELNQMQGY